MLLPVPAAAGPVQEPGLLLTACSQAEQYLRDILRPVVAKLPSATTR